MTPATASPVGGEPVEVQNAANTMPAEPPAHTAHAIGLAALVSERTRSVERDGVEADTIGEECTAAELRKARAAGGAATNAWAALHRQASANRLRRVGINMTSFGPAGDT